MDATTTAPKRNYTHYILPVVLAVLAFAAPYSARPDDDALILDALLGAVMFYVIGWLVVVAVLAVMKWARARDAASGTDA